MRFLIRHAEVITTVCVVLSIILCSTLIWVVNKRNEVKMLQNPVYLTVPSANYTTPAEDAASAAPVEKPASEPVSE